MVSKKRLSFFIISWDDSKNRRERKETQSKITTLCELLRLIFFAMIHLSRIN